MKCGYFDADNREYVITTPKTPVKWINYLGTLAFGGLIDQTGGMLLCKGDPAHNRITKYIPQLPDADFRGSTLYARVKNQEGSYDVCSPYFTPSLSALDEYRCHVGTGYQRIVSRKEGLVFDSLFFVPPQMPVVIWRIRVKNVSRTPANVDLIPVVEYSHFDALKQFTNADWVPQTMQSRAEKLGENGMALLQYAFMRQETAVNFLASRWGVSSFESDRKRFLGNEGYGTWRLPAALSQTELSCTEVRRGDNIGALMLHLGELNEGEEKERIVLVGQCAPGEVQPLVERLGTAEAVQTEFAKLMQSWEDMLSVYQCRTPEETVNIMVNLNNPRQCHTTLNWSRYLSLYQLGLGARGMGVRDSAQDSMGAVSLVPDQVKDLLRKLLSVQRKDGSAMHQFYPATMEANEGDSRESREGKHVYGDDHLWLILAVCAYLKETGDLAFLEEPLPFYRPGYGLDPEDQQPVIEHLRRALHYTQTHCGTHGLPLLGFADWNDAVNLPGRAESMFVACLYGRALLEMIELYEFIADQDQVATLREWHETMKTRFNQHCWDGEWYIRYLTEEGEAIGSSRNETGRIYTNAQSWPVLAGFATPERARLALEAVRQQLNTKYGIKLSTPGYNGFDPKKGGVTTYPPGAKENGGIFLHANPWVMIAETMLGRGNEAHRYYQQINPAFRNDMIEIYECEPYCYAQNILGDEHPQFGLARNSWLSGTASWCYQAMTQFILGVRPTYHGLMIDPVLPDAWNGVEIRRRFRGCEYRIRIERDPELSGQDISIIFNGQPLNGRILPLLEKGIMGDALVRIAYAPGDPENVNA